MAVETEVGSCVVSSVKVWLVVVDVPANDDPCVVTCFRVETVGDVAA